MLFIHGGAWLGSNRSDYCRPLFHEFLRLGFVVASMDYRLRPETSLEGQLSDVRDVEGWLRDRLAHEIACDALDGDLDPSSIFVVGASAGAHLALMTVSTHPSPLRLYTLHEKETKKLKNNTAQTLDHETGRYPQHVRTHNPPLGAIPTTRPLLQTL